MTFRKISWCFLWLFSFFLLLQSSETSNNQNLRGRKSPSGPELAAASDRFLFKKRAGPDRWYFEEGLASVSVKMLWPGALTG